MLRERHKPTRTGAWQNRTFVAMTSEARNVWVMETLTAHHWHGVEVVARSLATSVLQPSAVHSRFISHCYCHDMHRPGLGEILSGSDCRCRWSDGCRSSPVRLSQSLCILASANYSPRERKDPTRWVDKTSISFPVTSKQPEGTTPCVFVERDIPGCLFCSREPELPFELVAWVGRFRLSASVRRVAPGSPQQA